MTTVNATTMQRWCWKCDIANENMHKFPPAVNKEQGFHSEQSFFVSFHLQTYWKPGDTYCMLLKSGVNYQSSCYEELKPKKICNAHYYVFAYVWVRITLVEEEKLSEAERSYIFTWLYFRSSSPSFRFNNLCISYGDGRFPMTHEHLKNFGLSPLRCIHEIWRLLYRKSAPTQGNISSPHPYWYYAT